MSLKWLDNHRREAFIDFHSGAVASDLMADLDAEAYAEVLVRAHANRVTVFAKCHHGHAYYPTQVGRRHPYLTGDLFGQISTACHKRGMAVTAYQNVVRDGSAARENPDWQQTRRDGSAFEMGYRRHVCINSPYVPERLWPMTDEILENYPYVSGFFFDCTAFLPGGCFCEYCSRAMKQRGIDPDDDVQVMRFHTDSWREFINATTERVQARVPDAAVYYNYPAHVGCLDGLRGQLYWYIESMASVWGYEKTPFLGRYLRTKDRRVYAQTGRFHKAWGDFGGLKSEASLRYDAGLALALGAAFSIGDQAHPDGTLDEAAYERVGRAFAYYAQGEQWIADACSVPYVGLLCGKRPGGFLGLAPSKSDYGLLNALIEENVHFDVIDIDADLAPYKAVVAEDVQLRDEKAAEKLRAYVRGGGRLLVLGSSLFGGAGRRAVEEILGVEFAGFSPYSVHYVRTPEGELGDRLPKTDWVTYGPAIYMRPHGAQSLVKLVYPFTERTDSRAVSHAQAHPGAVAPFPAVTIHSCHRGQAIAVASPLGALYQEHSYPPMRILIKNLLDQLIPPEERVIEFVGPLSAEVILTAQGGRHIVHLLNFHTNRIHGLDPREIQGGGLRTLPVSIVEEIPPVLDAEVRLLAEDDPTSVRLVPGDTDLKWTREGTHIVIRVPRYDIHAMIIVE